MFLSKCSSFEYMKVEAANSYELGYHFFLLVNWQVDEVNTSNRTSYRRTQHYCLALCLILRYDKYVHIWCRIIINITGRSVLIIVVNVCMCVGVCLYGLYIGHMEKHMCPDLCMLAMSLHFFLQDEVPTWTAVHPRVFY